MIDELLRAELPRIAGHLPPPDWDDVLARAGGGRGKRPRRVLLAAGLAAAALVVAVATPAGRALVSGLGGFSSWLTGQPGEPVSDEEQAAFAEGNARSWLGFPDGTELRRLDTVRVGETTVELLGFRSGESTFCLRLVVTGASRTSSESCAPLDELRLATAPVLPVIVDRPVGKGTRVEWYGIDRVTSANLQITAGLAADEVRAVVLEDDAGEHRVAARSNAFLYVAEQPDVAQRVRRIEAETSAGTVTVPFVPAPFGIGGGPAEPAPTAPPAPVVERPLTGGAIGWLERREPVGEPLDAFHGRSAQIVARNVDYGRIVTPDPSRPTRVAVTRSRNRHAIRPPRAAGPPQPPPGDPSGVCTWLIERGGASGGCSPPDVLFRDGPITYGSLSASGPGAFVTLVGLAVDEVARVEALLAGGRRQPVPLAHNVYLVSIARPSLPARLVAYDGDGRVIGVTPPYQDFARGEVTPARGRARSVLRAESSTGATAEILAGPASDGGTCMFVRQHIDRQNGGVMVACRTPDWQRHPLDLNASSWGPPAPFVVGRVAPRVATVRIEFADGARADVVPTEGFVLYTVPPEHLVEGREVVAAAGLAADGAVVGRRSFRPPGG